MQKTLSAITIFLGSFLIFGVQPMVGNTLLPAFGGTAAVWTVCLAAFQTLLLAGYFYAHVMGGRQSSNRGLRVVFHAILLIVSSAWCAWVGLKFPSLANWASGFTLPAIGALVAVMVLCGLPYVLLSANSSLIQALATTAFKEKVYRLYAISTVGSLLGLFAYPIVIEPYLSLSGQWKCFAVGVAVYALLVIVLGKLQKKTTQPETNGEPLSSDAPHVKSPYSRPLAWFALSALSCFTLNAVTSHLTCEITPLPLMWAVLLGLYLLSYILAFTTWGAILGRWMFLALLPLCFGAIHFFDNFDNTTYIYQLCIGAGLIFFGGWVIHALLYKVRPESERLTAYYLQIALGGAFGGLIASIGFPIVTTFIAEYPVAVALLIAVAAWDIVLFLPLPKTVPILRVLGVSACILAFIFLSIAQRFNGAVRLQMRNFYGCGRVTEEIAHVTFGRDYPMRAFYDNGTLHGYQPAEGTWTKREPTSYFGLCGGGGAAITQHPKYQTKKPMRVAIAGMGVGTLAVYAREGDLYRFYEINPQVAALACSSNYFTFVSGAPVQVETVVDDARKALESERAANEEKWDILIIDVFSGDSIPPHLATREAFQLYLDRLAPDGMLVFHITNWHLNLSRMAKSAAREFNLNLLGIMGRGSQYCTQSYWAVFSRHPVEIKPTGVFHYVDYEKVSDVEMMTDDKHSLLPYLSLHAMDGI